MQLKILSWNVRRMNAVEKQMVVRLFLKNVRADVISLQETKRETVDRDWVKEVWDGQYVERECLLLTERQGVF